MKCITKKMTEQNQKRNFWKEEEENLYDNGQIKHSVINGSFTGL